MFINKLLLRIPQNLHSTRNFTVCFEGNIASGKTTSLKYLSKRLNIETFTEPINKWKNVHNYNLIDLMYLDSSRWGFAFESYAQLTRYQMHQYVDSLNFPLKLMERSIYSGRYCFTENFYRSGKLSHVEYLILDEYLKYLVKNNRIFIDLFVYLRTTPEIAHKRLIERSRAEECQISLEYLKNLHDLHEEWLLKQSNDNVLVIEANGNQNELYFVIEKNLDRITGNKNNLSL